MAAVSPAPEGDAEKTASHQYRCPTPRWRPAGCERLCASAASVGYRRRA